MEITQTMDTAVTKKKKTQIDLNFKMNSTVKINGNIFNTKQSPPQRFGVQKGKKKENI